MLAQYPIAGGPIAAPIKTSTGVVTNKATTVTFLVVDDHGNPVPDMTGLDYAFYDEPRINAGKAPVKYGSDLSVVNGSSTINIKGATALEPGGKGRIVWGNVDGTMQGGGQVVVGGSSINKLVYRNTRIGGALVYADVVYTAPPDVPDVPVPTVTKVTISPKYATGPVKFSALVDGLNSPSQDVTYVADRGTILVDGTFIPPAKTDALQVFTVTVHSKLDSNQFDVATVVIEALPIVVDPEPEPEQPVTDVVGTKVAMHFFTPLGEPLVNAPVEIQLKLADFNDNINGIIMPRLINETTDYDGRLLVELVPCDTPYYVTVFDSMSDAVLAYMFYVPEVSDPDFIVRLQDIVVRTEQIRANFDESTLQLVTAAAANAVAAAAEIKELLNQLKKT